MFFPSMRFEQPALIYNRDRSPGTNELSRHRQRFRVHIVAVIFSQGIPNVTRIDVSSTESRITRRNCKVYIGSWIIARTVAKRIFALQNARFPFSLFLSMQKSLESVVVQKFSRNAATSGLTQASNDRRSQARFNATSNLISVFFATLLQPCMVYNYILICVARGGQKTRSTSY